MFRCRVSELLSPNEAYRHIKVKWLPEMFSLSPFLMKILAQIACIVFVQTSFQKTLRLQQEE
jgi:hypothetical protein